MATTSVMQSPAKKRRINKTEKSRQYFDFSHEENSKQFYTCKICNRNLSGTKPGNLTSHLQTHPAVYAEIISDKSTIEYKRKKLLLDCVELVGVNGRAIKCLSDSAMISMNESVLTELKSAGRELNLRDPHLSEVKSEIGKIYVKIQQNISNEVKCRMLSLLVDIVTKCDRSIFGMSIQYMFDYSVKVRSIGMIELKQSHTGSHLASVIIARLNLLGIDLKQMQTITTDNASNMLKMVRDMETHLLTAANQPPTPSKHIPSAVNNDLVTNEEIEEILATTDDITEEEAYDRIYGNDDDDDDEADEQPEPNVEIQQSNETLLDSIKSNLTSVYGLDVQWDVTGVNCAEHTFQLAINDSIKELAPEHRNLIELCRRMAKYLRLSTTVQELNAADITYSRPHKDVPTRWCFMYIMVNFIFSLQKCPSSHDKISVCHFYLLKLFRKIIGSFENEKIYETFFSYIFTTDDGCTAMQRGN